MTRLAALFLHQGFKAFPLCQSCCLRCIEMHSLLCIAFCLLAEPDREERSLGLPKGVAATRDLLLLLLLLRCVSTTGFQSFFPVFLKLLFEMHSLPCACILSLGWTRQGWSSSLGRSLGVAATQDLLLLLRCVSTTGVQSFSPVCWHCCLGCIGCPHCVTWVNQTGRSLKEVAVTRLAAAAAALCPPLEFNDWNECSST